LADLEKMAVQDRVKRAYKESTKDPDATTKRTCVENDTDNPIPTADVHSKNVKIYTHEITPVKVDVEQSQALLDGTRRVIIRVRKYVNTTLKVSFVSGGTNTDEHVEINPGGYLDLDGLNFIGKTIYFQADKSGRKIEILTLY